MANVTYVTTQVHTDTAKAMGDYNNNMKTALAKMVDSTSTPQVMAEQLKIITENMNNLSNVGKGLVASQRGDNFSQIMQG